MEPPRPFLLVVTAASGCSTCAISGQPLPPRWGSCRTKGLWRPLSGLSDSYIATPQPSRRSRGPSGAHRVSRLWTPIHLLSNGTTEFWLDVGAWPPDRRAASLDGEDFTWTYAGNVGLAQGLGTAIEAAAVLGPGFRLLILGEGAARQQLERQAAEQAPGRVEFRDQVPQEQAGLVLRASGALLVSLSAAPELAAFVPSKLFDFAAVGRPLVLAAAGESARVAAEDHAALSVPPGDVERLANAVRAVARDPELAGRLVEGGRRLASGTSEAALSTPLSASSGERQPGSSRRADPISLPGQASATGSIARARGSPPGGTGLWRG